MLCTINNSITEVILSYHRPFEKFLNPLEVESISVRNAIKLDANHSLVVYKQNEEHIERRIVSGPIVFIPGPQEWSVIYILNCYQKCEC